jgi:hypothetical protein
MRGCVQVLCKHYAILHKGLWHPQLGVYRGFWNQFPRNTKDECTSTSTLPAKLKTSGLSHYGLKIPIFLTRIQGNLKNKNPFSPLKHPKASVTFQVDNIL